jgi:hypothetical protein
MQRTLAAMLVIALATGPWLMAHHSFAASYFEEQWVTVEGELEEFEFKSPHSWVHLSVREESGQSQRYSAEWASASRLTQRGISADTLKPGDRVVIKGSPGRTPGERKIHLKSIERPADGWAWRR